MKSGWYETSLRPFKIERIAGWYDVRTGDLPFSYFTLKVVECEQSGFLATPNVFFKSKDGIEYCCGAGNTVEAAVLDAVGAFYAEIKKHKALQDAAESDFVWFCWTPFGTTPFIAETNG